MTRDFMEYTVFQKHGSVFAALLVLIGLLLVVVSQGAGGFSYFDVALLSSGGATLALAAVGATLVILTGGFDLSVGAIISLVNVVAAFGVIPENSSFSFVYAVFLSLAVGGFCGLVNGILVAYLKLQSIVVTLSTMFIWQGVALLVMDAPGGHVPGSVSRILMGDFIPGLVPVSLLLLGLSMLLWCWIKRTPFGLHIYAIGGHLESAKAVGVNVRRTCFYTYVLAGVFYGLAGLFLSAQTGSGDPLVGNSLLLSVFAAVVVGGTRLGGGKGGPLGSIIGAYVLMIIVNILLILNISAYFSTIAQGCVLIFAVLLGSLGKGSTFNLFVKSSIGRLIAYKRGALVSQIDQQDRTLKLESTPDSGQFEKITLFRKYKKDIRYSLPALICFFAVVVATQFFLGRNIFEWSYWNALFVLSTFLIVLALGQGVVIFTCGLDLSIPWTIGLTAILFTSWSLGSNHSLLYALPLVLLIGAFIGLVNGLMVAVLGISPIVATLASNGILQGIALIYSGGTTSGFPPPVVGWLMTGKVLGVTPIVLFLLIFVIFSVYLLGKTSFGRHVYAVGSNQLAAYLSGVPTHRTLVLVYVLSSVCAAIVGVLLTGFSGQASLGMGDDYLLPSIAVIVVGGGLITGGRGHYLGILAGVLLLTALQALLVGSNLPYAIRPILFGAVLLAAVAALKEKSEG